MNNIATGKYRNLDNQEYWQQRSLEVVNTKWNDIKVVEKELKKQYRLAVNDIQNELQAFYQRYADENNLTYSQAMQQLNSREIGDYASRMQRLQQQMTATNNPFAISEMQQLVKQGQLQRLSSLLAEIDGRLLLLGHSEQMEMFTWLNDVYESTYYQTGFNTARGTGLGLSFTRLNERAIVEAITYPWSGMMFSERIWNNRRKLSFELKQTITNGLIRGSSVQRMSRELSDKMDSSYKNSLRLIRTETAEVLTSASSKSYEEYRLDEYQFMATLDKKTSSVCKGLDGQVFKLKDKQAGVNASPMHANCRSCIVPYFDGMKIEKRWSKLPDGEKRYVDGNISYDEWHDTYVN
ncbi:minor capsid protein [Sporosarcina beigongshangi]|uniref:minor capsid protein n=1 Tax=Sporosarcina beigongshangi TaxID=2782538 RepID=UPI0019395E03|nr:minor capsid protein [Sporosarcina beigongshangi]